MRALVDQLSAHKTLLIVVGLLLLAFFTLRTRSTDVAGDDLDNLLGHGEPVVLEFYSNT